MAVVTAVLVMWSDAAGGRASAAGQSTSDEAQGVQPGADGDLDYIRARTPAVPVTLADGQVVNLRTLAARKPILLLAVSPTCGACDAVLGRLPEWRPLLPEVDLRILTSFVPGHPKTTILSEPQSLHDPENLIRDSIQDWKTPSAVLLGADGMLAGGPVTGVEAIEQFVAEVYESLHGVRPEFAGQGRVDTTP